MKDHPNRSKPFRFIWRKSPVAKTIWVSYLIVLLMPLLLTVVLTTASVLRLRAQILECLRLRDPLDLRHVRQSADLRAELLYLLLVEIAVDEDDDLRKIAELVEVVVDVQHQKRERADDDETAHKHRDRGEGHHAVAP